jgi:hypothetical protein
MGYDFGVILVMVVAMVFGNDFGNS